MTDNFVIDNDKKADWALQKIKEHYDSIAEKENLADERIDQIWAWLENETQKEKKQVEHLQSLLHEYARKIKDENPEFKTKSLPFGKLQYRKQRPKWIYKDKLIEYAEEIMPDLIKFKKDVDKRELKKKCEVVNGKVISKETGEVVEGVEVVERGEKFSIKV